MGDDGEEVDLQTSANSVVVQQREQLIGRIHDYNKRHQLDLFRLDLSDDADGYSGALRFLYVDGEKAITKAVRLDSETTASDLIPRLVEKFQPGTEAEGVVVEQLELSVSSEAGEHVLGMDDRPLEVALRSPTGRRSPQFVLRRSVRSASYDNYSLTSEGSGSMFSERTDGSPAPVFLRDKAKARVPSYKQRTSQLVSPPIPGKRRSFFKSSKARPKSMYEQRTAEDLVAEHMKGMNQHGIVQVFGVGIARDMHSQYKSILATKSSTAVDVIKAALERYHVDGRDPNEYLLCDVIGSWKKDSRSSASPSHETAKAKAPSKTWITEHSRVLNADENPFVLQLLWKPELNFQRRFELRKRPPFGRHSVFDVQDSEAKKRSDELSGSGCYSVPASVPFLLNLRGYELASEYLIYRLIEDSTAVGRTGIKDGVGVNRFNIALPGPDILPVHCFVHQRRGGGGDEDGGGAQTWIEPMGGADVALNGAKIDAANQILPGDLISLGSRYLFLFKDPNQATEIMEELHWEKAPLSQLEKRAEGFSAAASVDPEANQNRTVDGDDGSSFTGSLTSIGRQRRDQRLAFPYGSQDEDVLLEQIILHVDTTSLPCKLAPAYLLAMMVEYTCTRRGTSATIELTAKIGEILQEVLWEKTRVLSEKSSLIESQANDLLPRLQPVMFWMSNVVELFHYLNVQLSLCLAKKSSKKKGGVKGSESLTQAVGKEVQDSVAVLEEITFYSFQQIMYPLTKVLYTVLPSLLEGNPFESESSGREIDSTLQFMKAVNELMNACSLHSTIVSQVFSNLFFFVNASLVNTLMDHSTGAKFYSWSKGVQIRCNLDLFNAWASKNGLSRELLQYAGKLYSIADFLATPEEKLIQMNWTALRIEFPSLHPVQLQRLLTGHQLHFGKEIPRRWSPTQADRSEAENKRFLLEGYDSHPPLRLPTGDFTLDLDFEPIGEGFQLFVSEIQNLFETEGSNEVFEAPAEESAATAADVSHVNDSVVIATGLGVQTPEKFDFKESQQSDDEEDAQTTSLTATDVVKPSENTQEERREEPEIKQNVAETGKDGVDGVDGRPPSATEVEQMTSLPFRLTHLTSVVEEEENDDDDEDDEEEEMSMQFVFTRSVVEEEVTDQSSDHEKGQDDGDDDDDDDDDVFAGLDLTRKREDGDGSDSPITDQTFNVRNGDGRGEEVIEVENTSKATTAKKPEPTISGDNGSKTDTDDESDADEGSDDVEDESSEDDDDDDDDDDDESSDFTEERDSDVDALMAKAAMLLGDDSDGDVGSPPPPGDDLDMAVLKKQLKQRDSKKKKKSKWKEKAPNDDGRAQLQKRLSIVEEEAEIKDESVQAGKDKGNVVKLTKKKGHDGVGLILSDSVSSPFARSGIYISGLEAGSAASKCGKIAVGDQLLAVDGRPVLGRDRKLAMKYISEAVAEVTLLISQTGKLQSLATSEC